MIRMIRNVCDFLQVLYYSREMNAPAVNQMPRSTPDNLNAFCLQTVVACRFIITPGATNVIKILPFVRLQDNVSWIPVIDYI